MTRGRGWAVLARNGARRERLCLRPGIDRSVRTPDQGLDSSNSPFAVALQSRWRFRSMLRPSRSRKVTEIRYRFGPSASQAAYFKIDVCVKPGQSRVCSLQSSFPRWPVRRLEPGCRSGPFSCRKLRKAAQSIIAAGRGVASCFGNRRKLGVSWICNALPPKQSARLCRSTFGYTRAGKALWASPGPIATALQCLAL